MGRLEVRVNGPPCCDDDGISEYSQLGVRFLQHFHKYVLVIRSEVGIADIRALLLQGRVLQAVS